MSAIETFKPTDYEVSSASTSPGQQLSAARQARKLSLDDVAQHIKFAPRQIEALEHDQYAGLPGATVIRGMVRSYARFLKLDSEPLLAQVNALLEPNRPTVSVQDMAVPFPTRAAADHRLWWLLTAIVAIAAALFLLDWALGARERIAAAINDAAKTTTETAAPERARDERLIDPSAAARTEGGAPATPSMGPGAEGSAAVEATGKPAAAVASSSAAAIAPTGSQSTEAKRLEMRFKRDARVEVRDGEGKSLVNRLLPAGSQTVIEGAPPLRVTIGAASGVILLVDGAPYDLAPVTEVDVARLTLK